MTSCLLPQARTHNTSTFSGTVAASTTVTLISEAKALQPIRYVIAQVYLLEPASGVAISLAVGGETVLTVPSSGSLTVNGPIYVDSEKLEIVGAAGTNPSSYAVTVVQY